MLHVFLLFFSRFANLGGNIFRCMSHNCNNRRKLHRIGQPRRRRVKNWGLIDLHFLIRLKKGGEIEALLGKWMCGGVSSEPLFIPFPYHSAVVQMRVGGEKWKCRINYRSLLSPSPLLPPFSFCLMGVGRGEKEEKEA